MPTPSLAEKVLRSTEEISQLGPDLFSSNLEIRQEGLRQLFMILGSLDAFALRRADASTTEHHRRVMETCHIQLPQQVTHG
jgi:hypothetical protein